YWITEVHYATAGPDDMVMAIQVTNAGPEADTLHVLPTAWFRNTWSWDTAEARPSLQASGDRSVTIDHPFLGTLELIAATAPGGADPQLLFCENETNDARLYGTAPVTAYPKDGINDHVVSGASTVNPDRTGTKCAFWYQVAVPPGQTTELRLRLRPATNGPGHSAATAAATAAAALGTDFDQVMAQRHAEADEFYAELTPAGASADEALVLRQACAGLLWSKQLFYYDVARWLDGDPTQPEPPESRKSGRNAKWRNFDGFDIISMPDKWEYPWFAAWDLAFHTVPLAHLDPAFAKYQLILVCREWFQHPNGALPAYEWDFGDVNPPVHAWAALQVFAIDGGRDLDFLSRVFDKLLVNFTWWVNREDAEGNNLFEGGFLGLDNIGPIDRSHLPAGYTLEQSDATGWMGAYALAMASIAAILNWTGKRESQDLVLKFLEHFAGIRGALDSQGLWDDADGLFYDRLITPSGYAVPVKVRSMVGIIPALAAAVIDGAMLDNALAFNKLFKRFLEGEGVGDIEKLTQTPQLRGEGARRRLLLSVARPDQLERLFAKLFDEAEFLSPHGLRALSAYHRDHPYEFDVGDYRASIDYEPAEST
ncbi:MAG: MGH1-like glycoside hydrolase domain-containing protein, partial [Streptosporangiaceae bacterium]